MCFNIQMKGTNKKTKKTAQAASPQVAVLDAGGQYVDLVKKACERLGYPSEILPLKTPVKELESTYKAIIISGSPASSKHEKAPMPDPELWQSFLPVLGICYGMQSMAVQNGGDTKKSAIREDGRVVTSVDTSHPLFNGLKKEFTALFTHGDFVIKTPEGFRVIGQHTLSNKQTAYSALASGNKVGVQFHPEVFDDTPEGYALFKNFFNAIAALEPNEQFLSKRLSDVIKQKRKEIKKKVHGRKVIAFISGGVDSSVAAALTAGVVDFDGYYIDSGYMRDEDEEVVDFLKKHMHIDVTKIDAEEKFAKATIEIDGKKYGPLEKEAEPQPKRKIIGKTYIDVMNDIVAKNKMKTEEVVLLQGTNAADRIESGYSKGDKNTQTIKTHHNLAPEARNLNPLEPLDDMFKDEIRALGKELGLPDDIVWRHPFPGPGLAVRIPHSNGKNPIKNAKKLRRDMQAYLDNHRSNTDLKVQILPVRSVGVGGDERTYLSVAALQGQSNWQNMSVLATDLPSHFRDDINRVVFALGKADIDNCTPTQTDANVKVRQQLRQADKIVFDEMRNFDVMRSITQFLVILVPASFGKKGERSIVLKPFITSTFMTVQAMLPVRDLPQEFLDKMTERILKEVKGISQVFLEISNKPPGTVEWE